MRYSGLLVVALLLLITVGCGSGDPAVPAGSSGSLQVVTSISPLADLIKNVGGDKVKVTALIKPGGDPHDFQPKPEDIKLVAAAKVFFANGAGEEPYLEKLVRNASSPGLKVVVLSDGMEVLGKGGGAEYASGNPHLWLDVQNAKRYVLAIRDNLAALSPQNKDYFGANAESYLKQLDELDKFIRGQIETIPPANRKMIVFHEAFPYFAKRYGLEFKSIVRSSLGEPSAKEYADLIAYVKEQKVKAVFGEAGFNPKLVRQLAKDTGVNFVDNLYDDTVADNLEADTYIKMMRKNTLTIVNSLK